MLIYILPVLFAAFLHFIRSSSSTLFYAFVLFLGFFLCGGYMCGTDWRSYEMIYSNINDQLGYYFLFYEPGFVIYTYLFKCLGIGFWGYTILTKVIIYAIFIYTFRKYAADHLFYLAIVVFLGSAGYALFIDCPFRNLISIGICLLAIPELIRRRCIRFMLIVLLAMMFHSSAVIMFLVYFFAKQRWKLVTYISLYVFLFLLFLDKSVIISFIENIFSWHSFIGARIEAYAEDRYESGGVIFSIGLLLQLIYLFFFFRIKNKIIQNLNFGNFLFNFTFLYFVFYRMALTIPVMVRLQFYMSIFYCIIVAYLLTGFQKVSRQIFAGIIVLASCLLIISSVTSTYRYVPYTNYFIYTLRDVDLDYSTRDMYNRINSPYKE